MYGRRDMEKELDDMILVPSSSPDNVLYLNFKTPLM